MNTKQVIVMRKDLNMRKGKMISQGAHASMGAVLGMMKMQSFPTSPYSYEDDVNVMMLSLEHKSALKDWIEGKFTKVCVSVDSEEELFAIVNEAQAAGLPCKLITDEGLTEFGGVPTRTCCAIGPAWAEDIDKITANLKLL